jgi:hypothetical protein
MDILGEMGGIQSVARELGISEPQAATGAAALPPALLGGFKSQAQAHPSGLEGFAGMLGSLGGGSLLDDVLSPEPTNVSRGKVAKQHAASTALATGGGLGDLLGGMLGMAGKLMR